MTAIINYLIEANIVLLLTLSFYVVILRHETNFRLMRSYLLISIMAGLMFPLIDISLVDISAPSLSISRVLPSYWLPEVTVGGGPMEVESMNSTITVWDIVTAVYMAGLFLGMTLVVAQLIQLFRLYRRSKIHVVGNLRVAESTENKPTFSFFNFIFIGNALTLTPYEKEQIVRHESVHAQQWHSFDILLINLLRIAFWFNPFINHYKNIFIQLHEFEADARAVEDRDVDGYCSLLARVALQSADFTLANHFNNSLTVKRIEMMRTIKRNIQQWKVASLGMVLSLLFVFIACQDQVETELVSVTQNSSHALIVPVEIKERYEQMQKEFPDKKFTILELNRTATEKIRSLESQYGLPRSMEIFEVADGKVVQRAIKGQSSAGVTIEKTTSQRSTNGTQTFAIIEFDENVSKISDAAATGEKIFTVVEEQPEFPGGYDSLLVFIRKNLRYPASVRQQGIEGTVYTSFIVEKDGSVTDVKTIRGISPDADAEAARVIQLFPKWVPGKQNYEQVRVRFVLPIKFKL